MNNFGEYDWDGFNKSFEWIIKYSCPKAGMYLHTLKNYTFWIILLLQILIRLACGQLIIFS